MSSHQSEVDYDKQFQDDLAKATALSLEQHALDEYRRSKKYGSGSHYERTQSTTSSTGQGSDISAVQYYAQLRERYYSRTSSHSESSVVPPDTPPPPPPTTASYGGTRKTISLHGSGYQQRRHSEVSSHPAEAVAATNAYKTMVALPRSHTPPPSQSASNAPENDLISFSSPTSKSTDDTASSFDKLIEDLQKLSSSTALAPVNAVATHTALVPIGPTAAAPNYRSAPATAMYVPGSAAAPPQFMTPPNTASAGLQLVPFIPPPQQQKVSLTPDGLQKLYNMPHQAAAPYPMGFYMPHPQNQTGTPVIANNPVAAAATAPQYAPYGYNYNIVQNTAPYYQYGNASGGTLNSATMPRPPTAMTNPGLATGPGSSNASNSSSAALPTTNASSSAVSENSVASNSILRRQTPPIRKSSKNPTSDLIDLSHDDDDSRVSVLEAFDPLLKDVEESCGNDDASDCTSYYAEYDPFDYLYSGGGTQYSDPVYEAVNKLDQSSTGAAASASSIVCPIGWHQDYSYTPTSEGPQTPFRNDENFIASSSQDIRRPQPPPLPPRNSNASPVAQTTLASASLYGNSSNNNDNASVMYPSLDNFKSGEFGSSPRYFAQTTEMAIKAGLNRILDRRKVSTRLYEMVTDQRTIDPELLEFYYMVKDLRARYIYDDDQTNVGHIIASEFNYHYPIGTSIKILVHPAVNTLFPDAEAVTKGQVKGYGTPVIFTCDITTAVEMVIGQAYCSLEGQIKGNVNDFAVKPIGVSEWLSPTSKLSQLECVHNSLKLERDVHFGLCLKTPDNMQVIARSQRDDQRDAALRAEDILPNEMASIISYDNMMILLETLEMEMEKLQSASEDSSSRSILSCSGVVQGVKAICALLGSIDTLEIANNVNELKRICEDNQVKHIAGNGNGSIGSNAVNGNGSANVSSNPEIVNDCGDYAEVCLRPRTTSEQIKLKCNQLRDAVQQLIELYSNVFRVGFSVKTMEYSSTPIPVSCILKPIVVGINCLHRPPPNWKYDDYSLGVQINYGTRFISDTVVAKCSNDTSGGLFARLNFSSWISFDKHPICTLPREARLIFVLFGTQSSENEQNADSSGERRKITTELGWCAIQLFDFKRDMICGPYLLSMWPATADKFLGPAPARGCHPQPDICPVLSIEVPTYGGQIQFPEPLENPQPAPRYDFNSLDLNLQQELLDTAEQGYSGAAGKREVFWEKRFYLQSFPNALAKVLHAAHSWDYASLMDLHSLLHSWSPLAPLQALEMLLPRYPDAKVREKAVEWISALPNDQLVDYLPQLLQALKHDTYEASSMARFLLCKCLESPRIAHHMYWLLVHCLPGDDPQNSIDASSVAKEIDDALITQARYYRRNKMMLRALLAVCGEKLLSRFLRQSMMCKNLASIAESVKDAKESLRQKSLIYGMESVHQELVEKPTSLPLGPELEVTGVNVRNCSYFNSNTLPLKISYIGPDAEILPAIFKSGDDLQQDMLTIQLIRVMNKMWLAEGLDLKIVTFNCVPTGYKKGMIELVSDAETLRKIQVEYGLTGSFKDRPIAEWLAKQNPSQLEYQRAVKNFTVSCAGYSVATYILGICDRHNDNIMLKTSGHLFHIDFGKFLGDAQMFGNFKRDRTPFVLTSDMAYVINGGDKPSTDFHFFVDLCCRAFNIIRKHGDLILHMLALMASAGITGVTADAVSYVRRALLPSQSNPEAAASFAKMIQFSLKNWFTQFNFFLHNLAQMRFTSDDGGGELLSFVPRKYTMEQDGRLKSVRVVRCQKHYDMEKYYTYILQVTRHGQTSPMHLFRSYKEFTEFHQKLCLHFPLAKLHSLPSGIHVGRSNVKSVAERRLPEIQRFLVSLFNSADEIAHSDLVYTFFHPLLRDQQEAKLGVSKVKDTRQITSRESPYEFGQLKLSLQYRRGALTVMIHHAKGLPMLPGGQEPNTYVKCYLKPDVTKATKRKTKVVRKTCVPSFMETLEYRMPLEHIQSRTLHVTVWSHDTLQENELLGGFQIDLTQYDLRHELIDWFRLGMLPRN